MFLQSNNYLEQLYFILQVVSNTTRVSWQLDCILCSVVCCTLPRHTRSRVGWPVHHLCFAGEHLTDGSLVISYLRCCRKWNYSFIDISIHWLTIFLIFILPVYMAYVWALNEWERNQLLSLIIIWISVFNSAVLSLNQWLMHQQKFLHIITLFLFQLKV